MNRRDLLKAGAALGTFALPSFAQAPAVLKRKRPNILMVLTDQQRHWLDFPKDIALPGHEWLFERGRGFLKHHVHTTPCSPSRSTIYTGLHTQHTGMTSNHGAPPFPEMAEVQTLGHRLRKLGYYTAYKGKWHLSHVPESGNLSYGTYPSTRNVLEPFGFSDYNDDGDPHGVTWTGYKFDPQTASNAVRWLHGKGRALSGHQPWMLAVNFTNPHDVMYFDDVDGAQEKTRLVRDYLSPLSSPPTEGVYTDDWSHLPLPKSYYAAKMAEKPWSQRSYADFCNMVYGPIDPKDERRWRAYQSYYFNCVRDADRHLLTVLRALETTGLASETIVVFSADHGEMAGAQQLRQKGPHMYKENIRVPLAIVHPEAKNAGMTEALSGSVDLVPTLLAMAGEKDSARDAALKGVDLSPVVAKPEARTARDTRGILFAYNTGLYIDPAFAKAVMQAGGASPLAMLKASIAVGSVGPSRDNPGFFRGVHEGRYKFARYFKPGEHHMPKDWATLTAHNELECFDTVADPDELVNLAHGAQAEKNKALLLKLNAQTNALIAAEIGVDDGREHPGPTGLYRL